MAQGQFPEVSFYVGIQIDMLPIIAGVAQGKTVTYIFFGNNMLRFEILGHAQGMDFFYNFTQVTILRTGISAILFVVLICKLNSRVVLFPKM